MLNKKYRLKKHSAFIATYKVKHSLSKGGITLWAGKEKTDDSVLTKVGFVVSKKTHKRAVKRNRLKRLMRESYRLIMKNKLAPDNYMSLIFVGHENALNKNINDIQKSIEELLKGIK